MATASREQLTLVMLATRLASVTVLSRLAQPAACPVILLNFDYLFHVARADQRSTQQQKLIEFDFCIVFLSVMALDIMGTSADE